LASALLNERVFTTLHSQGKIMRSSIVRNRLVALVAGVALVVGTATTASAQIRYSYGSAPRVVYPSGTVRVSPGRQPRFVSPSNRVTTYQNVTPGYNYGGTGYSIQPYSSGYRGSTIYPSTTYRNYGNYPQYNQYPTYRQGYGVSGYPGTTPGATYYPSSPYGYSNAPYSTGYRGLNYATPGQQRGATIGGTIGEAIGGQRGGNVGAAIGGALGQ
jgi:hypothetical protein